MLASASARVASQLLHRAATSLPLRLVYPDGTTIGADGPAVPTLYVHQPDSLARRVGRSGLIGFGESYKAGDWDASDLVGVLTAFATGVADPVPRALQRLRPITLVRQPRSQHNSREGARRNVSDIR
jgi:cyclopropane-fatty-acyl-phospholipid synthase